jgi:hypothetical protein
MAVAPDSSQVQLCQKGEGQLDITTSQQSQKLVHHGLSGFLPVGQGGISFSAEKIYSIEELSERSAGNSMSSKHQRWNLPLCICLFCPSSHQLFAEQNLDD